MNKIVAISGQGKIDDGLVALLNVLFPETGICTVASDMEGFESCKNPSSLDWRIIDGIERRLWQKFKLQMTSHTSKSFYHIRTA